MWLWFETKAPASLKGASEGSIRAALHARRAGKAAAFAKARLDSNSSSSRDGSSRDGDLFIQTMLRILTEDGDFAPPASFAGYAMRATVVVG